MAFFRSNLQILTPKLPNPTLLANVIQNSSGYPEHNKKFFRSWFWKKEKKEPECIPTGNVVREVCCRKRVPQCPEHICSGTPSRCLEEGYGKAIKLKKRTWFTFKSHKIIKQKPCNNCPVSCPPKELTVWEYLFGAEKPLPHPNTCRRAWKEKQLCQPEDPRLEDSRYKETQGDVLVYSEPPKFKPCLALPPGPKPKPPPLFRLPTSVICKKMSDSVWALDCYCACITIDKELCQSNLCPMHARSYKLPYAEMRPQVRERKFLSCKQGIGPDDMVPPPRSNSCNCLGDKTSFPPTEESCAYHAARMKEAVASASRQLEKAPGRKMSRCERLKIATADKESAVSLPQFMRKTTLSCESRCKGHSTLK